ncbi:MAG TPA: transposase [Ktedonobacteraceae bacterium]|nr:transposase [Ktedonobacteraceae bacterium]
MPSQYDTVDSEQQAIQEAFPGLAHQLETYLEPLLIWLDAYVDKRLVRTFLLAIAAILQFRGNQQALQLSELGAYLPCSGREPAKTKKLQRLLTSSRWGKEILDRFLWMKAQEKWKKMKEAGERILCIWDGSEIEKPESEKAKGTCGVVSSRAKRLRKQRKGIFNQRGGKPITVTGMEWTGIILVGRDAIPTLMNMVWWSRKGDRATKQREVERALLRKISFSCLHSVIHVFDRGYASGPWLEYLGTFKAQFVIRWKKGHHFLDENGQEMALSTLVGRTRSKWHKELWSFQKRCLLKTGVLVKRVRHADYAGWLYVVVVRQKGEPWYLVTNVPIETEKDAWDIVFAYRARWKIETVFRYGKSELCLETVNLQEQGKREKMLLIVMVVYMFLLWLMQEKQKELVMWLLQHYCHRTGKKQNALTFPIYRVRWAISRYWQKYNPIFAFTALGDIPKTHAVN